MAADTDRLNSLLAQLSISSQYANADPVSTKLITSNLASGAVDVEPSPEQLRRNMMAFSKAKTLTAQIKAAMEEEEEDEPAGPPMSKHQILFDAPEPESKSKSDPAKAEEDEEHDKDMQILVLQTEIKKMLAAWTQIEQNYIHHLLEMGEIVVGLDPDYRDDSYFRRTMQYVLERAAAHQLKPSHALLFPIQEVGSVLIAPEAESTIPKLMMIIKEYEALLETLYGNFAQKRIRAGIKWPPVKMDRMDALHTGSELLSKLNFVVPTKKLNPITKSIAKRIASSCKIEKINRQIKEKVAAITRNKMKTGELYEEIDEDTDEDTDEETENDETE